MKMYSSGKITHKTSFLPAQRRASTKALIKSLVFSIP